MISASADGLTAALRLLRARGFSPTGNRRGIRTFEGTLPCKGGPIKVRFEISDWDFLTYPAITVLERPEVLPPLAPHVDANGWLCYFAKGAVVLDRYDPAESIAQCLDQAQHVLQQIRLDPNYRHEDIQDEFLQHWYLGQTTKIWPVLIGTVDRESKCSNYWLLNARDESYAVIADDRGEVQALAAALGAEPPNQTKCPCWLFSTDVIPAVPSSMPSNVRELFAWLRDWDRPLHHRVQLVLERESTYLAYTFVTFAIRTPLGWLGFGFDLDAVHRLGAKKRPKLYSQFLHTRGGRRGIMRLSITEFGPDFVHNRNLTFSDLKGKFITVVGCGSIGSHIAQSLVRLGAGTGGGRLDLIDDDFLNPENLGRHVLGYPSLFKPKAEAMAEELVRQFPLTKVRAQVANVRKLSALFHADLVIDATGDEAVSEMINANRLEQAPQTPVLHTRIRGNGECVQTFWAQGMELGCFRCLLHAGHKNYRQERFPVLKVETTRKHLGCSGFTPYAVSAPMAAAALCMEVVVDWLQNGSPRPRFRTRAMASANVYSVKDQDVKRLPSCVACGSPDVATASARP